MRSLNKAATARNRQSTTKCGRRRAWRRSEILYRIDLCALKARRDLDADGVTRSLQGAKIYAKKQARAYNDGRYSSSSCGKRIWAMTCMRGKQILHAAYDGRQNFIRRRPR
ncbi:hypothetical protein [uncultured Campylobacter sp.]|uniref:hypothetical protein n=1 Tax=uncultured Campylobacter sp. TaxID=218934 RepID=UPI002623B7EA|nr:hypothetical protein [uncultured Campylobacter sp.]